MALELTSIEEQQGTNNYLPEATAEFAKDEGGQTFVVVRIPLANDDAQVLSKERSKTLKDGSTQTYVQKFILGATHNGKNKIEALDMPAKYRGGQIQVRATVEVPMSDDEG